MAGKEIELFEKERLRRIREGEAKYGPWDPEAFKRSGRSGIGEAIPELLDAVNYLEMAVKLGEIEAEEFNKYNAKILDLLRQILKLWFRPANRF